MLSQEKQRTLLGSLSEGDVFEHGRPFVFDSEEPLVWRCEESALIDTPQGLRLRVVLHVYFRGVMLRALVALVPTEDGGPVVWGEHDE